VWQSSSGSCSLNAGGVVGCLCSDSEADEQVHTVPVFFQFIQNWLKLVKSKWMPYLAPKIANVCMKLVWRILNNFLNCADFKFPTEIKLKILEQIQYLNP
jgi:hypothetical protein